MKDDVADQIIAKMGQEIEKLGGRPKISLVAQTEQAGIDEVGRMAADAVLRVYEETANQVEQMGEEVKTRIAALSKALVEADADLRALAQAATLIRQKGIAVKEIVEHAAETSQRIREVCAAVQQQLKEDA